MELVGALGAGAVIGAAITAVLDRQTQLRSLRVEVSRYWATRLHDAASELVTSYMLARSTLIHARQRNDGMAPTDDELAYELRRRAQARLFTQPDGVRLEQKADDLRRSLDSLQNAFRDPDNLWSKALHDQEFAVSALQRAVVAILDERSEI